jgi:hypothetical protein
MGLGLSVESIKKLAGIHSEHVAGLKTLEEDFAAIGLSVNSTRKTAEELRETMLNQGRLKRMRQLASIDPYPTILPKIVPPTPPTPPTPPITSKGYPITSKGYSVAGYTGVNAMDFENELVSNPNESYREPGKVHFSDLLGEAGLNFRRVVEVYSLDYSPKTVAKQKELIDHLNNDQGDVTFVLVKPKQRRKWWERLFRRIPKKATIATGPCGCGCYPCYCELFCHKQSLLPENTR